MLNFSRKLSHKEGTGSGQSPPVFSDKKDLNGTQSRASGGGDSKISQRVSELPYRIDVRAGGSIVFAAPKQSNDSVSLYYEQESSGLK